MSQMSIFIRRYYITITMLCGALATVIEQIWLLVCPDSLQSGHHERWRESCMRRTGMICQKSSRLPSIWVLSITGLSQGELYTISLIVLHSDLGFTESTWGEFYSGKTKHNLELQSNFPAMLVNLNTYSTLSLYNIHIIRIPLYLYICIM